MTAAHEPITDLTELVATWTTLLETAPLRGRNLWLMFLDPSARPLPALTQIEGLSRMPARSTASASSCVTSSTMIASPAARHCASNDRARPARHRSRRAGPTP